MPDLKQFLLPDVGEGLTEAEIIKWNVAPGDTVTINQTLVEIETAKAAVELPSPYAGVVTALHVAAGETVAVGRPIITIDIAPAASATAWASGSALGAAASEGRQPVLVGYGPKADRPARRPRVGYAVAADPTWSDRADGSDAPHADDSTADDGDHPSASLAPVLAGPAGPAAVLAKPPVRMLARQLGVDLDAVTPTGPNGSVSRADVEQAAARPGPAHAASSAADGPRATRLAVRGVRKHMAAAMVASAFTAPHVSMFQTVDVSAMMELRERIAARPEFAGVKVSPLVLVAKAVIIAAAATPELNASWDEANGEIVLNHYVNLGIAAATPRGLVVPNIKDADRLSLRELAIALAQLTETARAGQTAPAALAGGTITITNIGVYGIDTGTPIINPGESGIVALGAIARRPWVVDEQVLPRWVTTLALSFDHRVADGEQGARFLATVTAVISDPGLALL